MVCSITWYVWLLTIPMALILRSLETNKHNTGENTPSSPSSARGRSKSRHRLHGVVKSSTSSPTSSPGRTLRSSPGSSVLKCSAKADSRHAQSSSKADRAESASGLSGDPTPSSSNQLVGSFSSVLRSRNYDDSSDNQTEATSNESGIVCSLDEMRPVRSVIRASELCNRRNYDSDDNGNNSASTAVAVHLGSPSYSSVQSLRCKPRRFKRVMSAGQSLEVLSTSHVDDSRLQVPQAASHGRPNKREVISLLIQIWNMSKSFYCRFILCACCARLVDCELLPVEWLTVHCVNYLWEPATALAVFCTLMHWNEISASCVSDRIAVMCTWCFFHWDTFLLLL